MTREWNAWENGGSQTFFCIVKKCLWKRENTSLLLFFITIICYYYYYLLLLLWGNSRMVVHCYKAESKDVACGQNNISPSHPLLSLCRKGRPLIIRLYWWYSCVNRTGCVPAADVISFPWNTAHVYVPIEYQLERLVLVVTLASSSDQLSSHLATIYTSLLYNDITWSLDMCISWSVGN